MKGTKSSSTHRWSKPAKGWIRCNVDGVFYSDSMNGATGYVLRRDDGTFRGAQCKWYDHALSALVMEALAYRDGIQFALQENISQLIVETDSKELVNLWLARKTQRSEVSSLLMEIEELVSNFMGFKFVYVPRPCNIVAHCCAKLAPNTFVRGEWRLEASQQLLKCLDCDCDLV